jgi:hypothetical protein
MTTTIDNNVNVFSSPSAQHSSKMHDYRAHLRAISDGLIEMAKAAGRSQFTCNQLLRECYNLVNAELKTYEEWKQEGAYVRRGEHAYLFWGSPITKEDGGKYFPIEFRFCREQVRFKQS